MTINFEQLFGENGTQNETTITIQKSDLPNLIPDAINTAESIIAGLVLLWSNFFIGGLIDSLDGELLISPNGENIAYTNSQVSDINVFYWRIIREDNYLIFQFVVQILEQL